MKVASEEDSGDDRPVRRRHHEEPGPGTWTGSWARCSAGSSRPCPPPRSCSWTRARRTAPRSGPRSIRSAWCGSSPPGPAVDRGARPVRRRAGDDRRACAVPRRRHGALPRLARPCAPNDGEAARRGRRGGNRRGRARGHARHDGALARGGRGRVAQGPRSGGRSRTPGGAALHRRSVLEATGSFHPSLRSEEEPELCLRIRDAGHTVLHLDTPIALHYSTPARTVATLLARRRRRLLRGHGPGAASSRRHTARGARTSCGSGGTASFPGLGLVAGAAALATGIGARRWWPFALWATALSSTVGIHAARRRSVGDAMVSLVQRACIVEGTIREVPHRARPARNPSRALRGRAGPFRSECRAGDEPRPRRRPSSTSTWSRPRRVRRWRM